MPVQTKTITIENEDFDEPITISYPVRKDMNFIVVGMINTRGEKHRIIHRWTSFEQYIHYVVKNWWIDVDQEQFEESMKEAAEAGNSTYYIDHIDDEVDLTLIVV